MLGRRLLALLVAVLCIVARLGLETDGSPVDEVEALAGPGLVGRASPEAAMEPVGFALDDLVEPPRAPGSFACVALGEPCWVLQATAPARERRGDPKASRGPPSFVAA